MNKVIISLRTDVENGEDMLDKDDFINQLI